MADDTLMEVEVSEGGGVDYKEVRKSESRHSDELRQKKNKRPNHRVSHETYTNSTGDSGQGGGGGAGTLSATNGRNQRKCPIGILPGELIVAIFQHLDSKRDQWSFASTCRQWFHSTIEWVWFRPMLTSMRAFELFLRTLSTPVEQLAIPYGTLVRRLNLTSFASTLDDDMMLQLMACTAIERLTLTGCSHLTDRSLRDLILQNPNLQSIDVSSIKGVSNEILFALGGTCHMLQGIYAADCRLLDDDGIGFLARQCPLLKRVKMNGTKISDASLSDLVSCKHIVELDLANTSHVSNAQITRLLMELPHLREFRIANISEVTDEAFYRLAYRREREEGDGSIGAGAGTTQNEATQNPNGNGPANMGDGRVDVDRESNSDVDVDGDVQGQLQQQFQRQFQQQFQQLHGDQNMDVDMGNFAGLNVTNNNNNNQNRTAATASTSNIYNVSHQTSSVPEAVPVRLPLFDRLRIIDLTSCNLISDASVARFVKCAPRLRNVVLAKCNNITDRAVICLAQLGQSLHYLHLGHCTSITDKSISILAKSCPRIQYIDVASCIQLTNAAVKDLATLPKLKRIGLVKCHLITDTAVNALADRPRAADGENTVERVHLSYCSNISLYAITKLVNSCMRLTHLSLTGVEPFLREDLTRFCRPPPSEFTPEQRNLFCVFSGKGVERLRDHLNAVMSEQGQNLMTEPALLHHPQHLHHLHQQVPLLHGANLAAAMAAAQQQQMGAAVPGHVRNNRDLGHLNAIAFFNRNNNNRLVNTTVPTTTNNHITTNNNLGEGRVTPMPPAMTLSLPFARDNTTDGPGTGTSAGVDPIGMEPTGASAGVAVTNGGNHMEHQATASNTNTDQNDNSNNNNHVNFTFNIISNTNSPANGTETHHQQQHHDPRGEDRS